MPTLRNDLRLELLDRLHGRVVAPQVVAEELPPLRLRELAREHRALVPQPVQTDAAGDVPREPLVDRDLAVCLRPDEVRAGERPDDERREDDDQRRRTEDDRRAGDAAMMALPAVPPARR